MRLSELFIWIVLSSLSLPALAQEKPEYPPLPPINDADVRAVADKEFKGTQLRSEILSENPINHSPFDTSGEPSYLAWTVRQGKGGRLMHAAFLIPASQYKKVDDRLVLPDSLPLKYLLILAYNGVRGDYWKGKPIPVLQQVDFESAGRRATRVGAGLKMYLQQDEWIWVSESKLDDETKDLAGSMIRDLMLKWPNVSKLGAKEDKPKEQTAKEEGPTLDIREDLLRELYLSVAATGQPARSQVLWMSPVGGSMIDMSAERPAGRPPFGESEEEDKTKALSPEERLDPTKSYVVWVERQSSLVQIVHEFYLLPASQIPEETRRGGAAPDAINVNNLVAFGFNGSRYHYAKKFQPDLASAYEKELMDRRILRPEFFFFNRSKDFAITSAIEFALKSAILKGTEGGKGVKNWSEKLGLTNDDLERISSEFVASTDLEIPGQDGGTDRIYFHYSGLPTMRAYEVYSALQPDGFDAKEWGKKANHLWVGFEITPDEERELKNGDCFVMSPIKGVSICIRDVLGLSFHLPLSADVPGSKLALVPDPGSCGLEGHVAIIAQAPDFLNLTVVKGIRSIDQGKNRPSKRVLVTAEVTPAKELIDCLLPKATVDMAAGMSMTTPPARMTIDSMVSKK